MKKDGDIVFLGEDGETWEKVSPEATASMNFWGFTKHMIGEMEKAFPKFLDQIYLNDQGSNNFTEVSQVGLEYIGNIGAPEISEVLDMAAISLELIDDEYILEVSNMDFADSILKSMGMEYEDYAHMLTLIRQKNIDGIRKLGNRIGLVQEDVERVAKIPKLYGPIENVMGSARKICKEQAQEEYLNSFARVLKELKRKNSKGKVHIEDRKSVV